MRELIDDEDVRAASGNHPLIAHAVPYRVPGGRTAYAHGAAMALRYDYWDVPSWFAVGPDADLAELVPQLPPGPPEEHLAVPQSSAGLLTGAEHFPWGFAWRSQPVGAVAGAAEWLPSAAAPEVDELLDASFPHASTRPISPKANRWAGIRDQHGTLVACIVDSSGSGDVGFVASLTVASSHRGRGLGERLLGWTVDELLTDRARVGLWYEGTNQHAIAIYERLGFEQLPMVSASFRRGPSDAP